MWPNKGKCGFKVLVPFLLARDDFKWAKKIWVCWGFVEILSTNLNVKGDNMANYRQNANWDHNYFYIDKESILVNICSKFS